MLIVVAIAVVAGGWVGGLDVVLDVIEEMTSVLHLCVLQHV